MTVKVSSVVSNSEPDTYGYAAKLLKANATIASLEKQLKEYKNLNAKHNKGQQSNKTHIHELELKNAYIEGQLDTYQKILYKILKIF